MEKETRYWSEIVGVPPESFLKPMIKRHNPRTTRHNVGEHYHGCLVVRVRRSSKLYLRVEALAKAVLLGSTTVAAHVDGSGATGD